jgi:hypothetical protein
MRTEHNVDHAPVNDHTPLFYRAKVGHYIRTVHKLIRPSMFSPEGKKTGRVSSDSFPIPKVRDGREKNPKPQFVSHPIRSLGRGNSLLVLPSRIAADGDEPETFRPLTAAEILRDTQSTRMVWVWDRFIPEGSLVLLSAFMKVGKSTLGYELAMAVVRGTPYLGCPTQKGRVLILAVEEHHRDAKLRLLKLGMKPTDGVRLWPWSLPPHMVADELPRYIRAHKIKLVILDTLSGYWKPSDENSNAEVHLWIAPLRKLARNTGAAVLVIHHDRKGGGQHGEQVRGGGDLVAQADQVLLLGRGQNLPKTQRVLTSIGRYRDTPRELILEWTGNPARYVSLGTPQDKDVNRLKARVKSALRDGSKDMETLHKQTGIGLKTLKKLLNHLQVTRIVSRSGHGRKGDPHVWKLTRTATQKASR